jgi:hypothetical protein
MAVAAPGQLTEPGGLLAGSAEPGQPGRQPQPPRQPQPLPRAPSGGGCQPTAGHPVHDRGSYSTK